ncbi:unnamed protein product [Meloidogyne enterolobii]|uniref:Uncharacterized protein n=1 Tax=Meloidogyne enterolobii TaxID=390850 RepID=A0ACB1AC12_MELEN
MALKPNKYTLLLRVHLLYLLIIVDNHKIINLHPQLFVLWPHCPFSLLRKGDRMGRRRLRGVADWIEKNESEVKLMLKGRE